MNISKTQLDRYIATKRDLLVLEEEHADTEKRLLVARALVEAFEGSGVSFDPKEGVIRFKPRPSRHVGASVSAEDLF